MFDFSLWVRIVRRCMIEFGPPAACAVYVTWPHVTSSGVSFSATFVGVGLFWWNFLRIQYQQTTRARQDDAAARLEGVSSDLVKVQGTLDKLMHMVSNNSGNLSPEQKREMASAVNEANNTVLTANNAIQSIGVSIGRAVVRGALGGLLRDKDN